MLYFIEDVDGKIGHPTKKADMIRRWLKSGKAKFKKRSKDWILVKITKKIDASKTIPCQFQIGLDPGYLNIGFAIYKVTTNSIEKIFVGEVELRTNQVTENLTERKMYRQNRRHNRRKRVKRKYGSCKFRKPTWKNRKKHPWQPTHIHLIQSHINVLKKLFQLIPQDASHVVFEYTKFDSHKIVNSTIKRWEYAKGPQYGFENVKNYVRARDKYTCQSCKERGNMIEAHHIIPRSQHGTDTPENMVCLCLKCHVKIQNNLHLSPKPKPQLFVASGVLNSVSKEIFKQIGDMVSVSKTYGYVTDAYRKDLKLEKTHAGDASIIAFCDEDSYLDLSDYTWIEDNVSHMFLKQFRRHVRNWNHQYEDRKYKVGKTIVAWNRRCRDGQDGKKKPSLEMFRHEIKNRNVKLTVFPGVTRKRRSNTQILFKPGDSLNMIVNNQLTQDVCQGWASTQRKVGGINNGYIKKKLVKRYLNSSGLVIVNKI